MSTKPAAITRRRFGIGLVLSTAGLACSRVGPTVSANPRPTPAPATVSTPVAFISHGAPTLATDATAGADLRRWGQTLARPRAIVVISAHWQTAAAHLGTATTRKLIYDFSGFPQDLYRVPYAAPGAPDVAQQVAEMLAPAGPVQRSESRGWDHGVWVPLLHMFPGADVPLLQVSLPRWPAKALFDLGRRLAPLRRQGVLLIASGGFTHNLRMMHYRGPTPDWALAFDDWATGCLSSGDVDSLLDYPNKAPALAMAHPTDEHWTPMMVALGAAAADGPLPAARFPVTGWEYAHLSRRSVQLG